MNTLMRRNPFGDLDQMLDTVERTFETLRASQPTGSTHALPLDIFEKADALFVRASVPGVKADDIELTVEKNILTLRGEQRAEWESEDAKVYRREIRYGKFSRSIRIPEGYLLDQVEATFDAGVLTIRIPRAQSHEAGSRRIPVRTESVLPTEPEPSTN